MTYYNQIEQLITKYFDFWDYYSIHHHRKIDKLFSDPLSFIEETFMFAGKKLLAPTSHEGGDEFRPKLSDARAAHSVSAFFLGALIAQRLFDGAFSFISTESNRYNFSYIWTLVCLYHDCGYALEKDHTLVQRLAKPVNTSWTQDNIGQRAVKYPHWLGMAKFRKEMNLWQSIWSAKGHKSCQCRKRLKMNLKNRQECKECRTIREIADYYQHSNKTLYFKGSDKPICFPVRKSNEINRYFAYRLLTVDTLKKEQCIDHGIAGGYLFFDRIIRNYAKKYMLALRENPDTDISNFINPNDYSGHPLRFSFDQLPLFAYISDCIINHNIWSERSDTPYGQLYQKMGMSELLIPQYERVNFFRNPLLFILAISDSIEPYKLFSTPKIDKTPYNIDQLKLLFNDTGIEILYDRIVVKPPKPMNEKFQEKLEEIKDWVDVDWLRNVDTFEIIPRPAD